MSSSQLLLMGEGAGGAAPNYIEDVFSTYLYTGTGSALTINNGIDLSTKGGLTWIKSRSAVNAHALYDTARGATFDLVSNTTAAQTTQATGLTAFGSTGFSIGTLSKLNTLDSTYASWTFRKQPKFFDVVTYTGTGSARTVAHSLGSAPGCVIVKRTDSANDWIVWHRSGTQNNNQAAILNATDSYSTIGIGLWGSSGGTPDMNSSTISIGGNTNVNAGGGTFVAYVFAHDAGGFGLTGTDNVISCGTYTGNGSTTGPSVTLGYEPQWVMIKNRSNTGNWLIQDVMRGMPLNPSTMTLFANLSNAETSAGISRVQPTATGFQIANTATADLNASGNTYIYIAIRRDPMKVPTSGTSVFGAETWAGTGTSPRTFTSANWTFPADLVTIKSTSSATWSNTWGTRLTGSGTVVTNTTNAELTSSTSIAGYVSSFNQTGYTTTAGTTSNSNYNNSSASYVSYNLRRAPSFMDIVCYTGNSTSARTVNHNLTVSPELMIVKCRTSAITPAWIVYAASEGTTKFGELNSNNAFSTSTSYWSNTSPTSSVFTLSNNQGVNRTGDNYIAYLFATCAGVSKVGSYTGNGTTQTIDCGFTAGARFVLIKRTTAISNWYYYDSVRGMTVLTDPYLLFNSTAAQVATLGSVTTVSTGFALDSTILSVINISGETYIFLAIA